MNRGAAVLNSRPFFCMRMALTFHLGTNSGECYRTLHHEVGHELRSSAEDENGGILFPRVLSLTRHSRARGNPGLLRRISLDTRFRGYDGIQAGFFVLLPKRVFSKEDTKKEFDRKERKGHKDCRGGFQTRPSSWPSRSSWSFAPTGLTGYSQLFPSTTSPERDIRVGKFVRGGRCLMDTLV